MVLGKKVAIFDWEWGRNSAPRGGQKPPCKQIECEIVFVCLFDLILYVHSTIFQLCGTVFLDEPVLS